MLRMLIFPIIFMLFCLSACVPVSQKAPQQQHRADVHYKLAMAHLQANNPTLALKELLIAVKQEPQNSSIQVALAQAYQRKKAYSLAEKHYLKALELSVNEPRYQNNLASLYLDMEKWDKAISYFDKASRNLLFLNVHVAVTGKAYAYFKKKDYSTALNYFKEAIMLAPRYAPAYLYQSEVYHAMGDLELEKISLQRAIDIAPQFSRAHYQLAVLLMEENYFKEAEQELSIILDYAPFSEWGLKAKELLRTLPEP